MYTYLKFGLPRVFPPVRRDNSSGYDSSEDGSPRAPKQSQGVLRSRSETALNVMNNQPLRSASEANLLTMAELRPQQHNKRRFLHKALPNFQLRNVHYDKGNSRILETINLEARGGDMVGIMATSSKIFI